MKKYPNKIVTNRKSPSNEDAYINAYKSMNPKASRNDNYDIAAVISKDGTRGHAMLSQSANRSKDRNPHQCKEFIPDDVLRKNMKK